MIIRVDMHLPDASFSAFVVLIHLSTPTYRLERGRHRMENTASVHVFYSLYHILLLFHPFCSLSYLKRNTPSIILLHLSMNFNAPLTLCK